MTATAPGAGWNTNVGFDDSGWAIAGLQSGGALFPLGTHNTQRIWDAVPSSTIYFRKVFTTAAAASAAIVDMAVDDDVELYINGTLVVNNADCTASNILNTNVLAQIVTGQNLIAAKVVDCGGPETFGFYMDVVTATPVPVMGPTGMLLLSLGLALAAAFMIRKKEAFGSSANL